MGVEVDKPLLQRWRDWPPGKLSSFSLGNTDIGAVGVSVETSSLGDAEQEEEAEED